MTATASRHRLLSAPYPLGRVEPPADTGGGHLSARAVSFCFLLVTFLIASEGPARATTPGANGKIAYVDASDIWVMNPDGSARTQLTSTPESDSQPDWSPDGTKIAFDRYFPAAGHTVYVMDADGGNQHLVATATTHFWGASPSWSPDGTRIAFVSGAGPRIWTVNADGSNPADVPITGLAGAPCCSLPDEEIFPRWSPDGLEIAFTACFECEAPVPYGIAVVPPEGGEYRSMSFGFALDWSPDSAYLLQSDHGDFMYRILRDGTDQQIIAFGPQFASWSPDGSKIAVDDPLATDQVIVMDADGGNPAPIGVGAHPDWQSLPTRPAKNRAKACQYERERLGEAAFAAKYGGGANAHGKCVSQKP